MTLPRSDDNAGIPIPFRMRDDLLIQYQPAFAGTRWVVKDPISERYFEFHDHEFRLLQMLDGSATLSSIQRELSRLYGPELISRQTVTEFLRRLLANGIVLCNSPGEGARLLRLRNRNRSRRNALRVFNILCIRFRGVDPDKYLQKLLLIFPWLFSRSFVICGLALIFSAMVVLTTHLDVIQSRLPSMSAFLGVTNLLWIGLALSVTKILHELGHAIACKKFGGECHDLGLLFLVFAPCLYCDVSDSWLMSSRWHRMGIAAAGIFTDLMIASCCTLLWWFSFPGWFNSWCLNLVFVCSIATLLFNGNPLLRYDGYFLLSDAVAIPNLMQQSIRRFQNFTIRLVFGVTPSEDVVYRGWRSQFLLLYAVFSLSYRLILMIAIYRLLHLVLDPYGIALLADIIGVTMLLGVANSIVRGISHCFREVVRRSETAVYRKWTGVIFLGLLLAVVFLAPIRRTITAPLFIDLTDGVDVYLMQDGVLTGQLRSGSSLIQGQSIAQFESGQLESDTAALRSAILKTEARISAIEASQFFLPEGAAMLPELRQTQLALSKQLGELEASTESLTIKAVQNGRFINPPERLTAEGSSRELPGWTGFPLETRNGSISLPEGTLIGRIASPGSIEARIAFEESWLSELSVGQRVDVICAQCPSRRIVGQILEIAPVNVDDSQLRELLLWKLPLQLRPEGNPHLPQLYYEARVALEGDHDDLRVHAPGVARIHLKPLPIATRLLRFVSRTFRSI